MGTRLLASFKCLARVDARVVFVLEKLAVNEYRLVEQHGCHTYGPAVAAPRAREDHADVKRPGPFDTGEAGAIGVEVCGSDSLRIMGGEPMTGVRQFQSHVCAVELGQMHMVDDLAWDRQPTVDQVG